MKTNRLKNKDEKTMPKFVRDVWCPECRANPLQPCFSTHTNQYTLVRNHKARIDEYYRQRETVAKNYWDQWAIEDFERRRNIYWESLGEFPVEEAKPKPELDPNDFVL